MEDGAASADPGVRPAEGYVGRIPVRNLWLLILYASDLFRTIGKNAVSLEENPDDLPDLVAEILARAVEERQRRHLSLGYRSREAPLNRVRGRIDALSTERRQLLARGLVACRFDELTIDTPRNRFVRAALEKIARSVRRRELAHRCRKLAHDMKMMGVSGIAPTRAQISADRFGRHDAGDRHMVAAAKLAFDLALPAEAAGKDMLPLPDREEQWVRRLFERAVAGFFDVMLSGGEWHVAPGRRLSWQIGWSTPNIEKILPSMQTDIVLDHLPSRCRIVIDTKFNAILTHGWHRDETLRNGYLYQIYAYLRSQVDGGDPFADRAEGVLLHPTVGRDVCETAVIQGHRIRFMTVDLARDAAKMRAELLRVADLSWAEP